MHCPYMGQMLMLIFFTPFSLHSHTHSDNTLIIGGDFNMVSDSGIDRLSTTGSQWN